MKMIVVVNEQGQVVAATHAAPEVAPEASAPGVSASGGSSCGLGALPGQRVEVVEIPEQLKALNPEQRLRAMLDHRLPPGSDVLEHSPRTKK